jgi:hypothetical protein
MTWAYRRSPLVKSHEEEREERWLKEWLRKRTTVSQEWLAEKLSMRSAANVSQQLRRLDRRKAMGKLPETMRGFLAGIRTAQE